MSTAKGLHLWTAKFGYTTLYITTQFRSLELAARRAKKAAKDSGLTSRFEILEYKGTIDA